MYVVHVDVFTDHESLQYMLTQRELNLRQQRWLELLKHYDVNVHYILGKSNIVVDDFSRMSMGSTAKVEDGKKVLVKDIHRPGVRLVDSTSGMFQLILVVNHP